LNPHPDSKWSQYFTDNEMLVQIDKDCRYYYVLVFIDHLQSAMLYNFKGLIHVCLYVCNTITFDSLDTVVIQYISRGYGSSS